MKNILFVASEGVPFIKTGGLADVVGSLPKCIDKRYFDIRVVLPKYSCIRQDLKDKMKYRTHFYMDYNWRSEYVGVLEAKVDGITYYFIDMKVQEIKKHPRSQLMIDNEKRLIYNRITETEYVSVAQLDRATAS